MFGAKKTPRYSMQAVGRMSELQVSMLVFLEEEVISVLLALIFTLFTVHQQSSAKVIWQKILISVKRRKLQYVILLHRSLI
jgi:hypothetical protein